MMGWLVVLVIVFRFVCVSWYPVHNIVDFINSIAYPMESHAHCFGPFLISLFVIPDAHKLSTWIGVSGCGWPILCSFIQIGAAFWSL